MGQRADLVSGFSGFWRVKRWGVGCIFGPLVHFISPFFFFLSPFRAYGNKKKWECDMCVCYRGVGIAQTKLLASLISCLAFSAPVCAHMLATGPRGCLLSRILLSTVSWAPRHLINIKYRLQYLSVIIVVYSF